MALKIKLTWFKDTGKWYTDEEIEFPHYATHTYHEILSWVRAEKKYERRPGPICLVEIEGYDEPRIIVFGTVHAWGSLL